MRECGSVFVECLENYLPSEQSKLSFIGSKVLDIFYDEFVKFVPAYILKREEDKNTESPLQQTQALFKKKPSLRIQTNKIVELKTT